MVRQVYEFISKQVQILDPSFVEEDADDPELL